MESGVTDFVVGHYGAFDGMAAKVIKAAKAPPGGDAGSAAALPSI